MSDTGPQFDAQRTPAESLAPGRRFDDAELLEKFARWDDDLTAHWSEWVAKAQAEYDFVAGHQWTSDEVAQMENAEKIPVTFNIAGPVIDAVVGAEISNRQQVQFYPRNVEDTGVGDVLTQGAEYVNDQCNGDQEDSEAFWDCLVCGVGWTEIRVEVDGHEVSLIKERVDPLQMKADGSSRKRCFEDGRYLKREIPMSEDEFDDFKTEIGRDDIEGLEGGVGDGKRLTIVNPRQRYHNGMLGEGGYSEDTVVVCEWQWWEREPIEVGPAAHPTQPNVVQVRELNPDELRTARAAGQRTVKSTKRVYYRAFATDEEILFSEPLPEGRFRYQAMTGKRDRNRGTYYGLVRPMLEPQKFTNKLYSEIMHIIRTNANGGMALEEDAVSDVRVFEDTWAATDKITWLKPGSLSGAHGSKMIAKTPPAIQPALFQLMEFARDMVKACTGVNEEILGLVQREQAGVLEQQRKQAAYGILSAFFDSKRRYQRNNGHLLLGMMRQYMPDDTMLRIVEQGSKKWVPLSRAMGVDEYDIIVDEAPAGPNAKQRVTAILAPLLPQLLEGGLIGAEEVADSIQYLDLPASVAEKLANGIRTHSQQAGQPDQSEQAQKQAELENTQADTDEKQASVQQKKAAAFKAVTDAHASHIGLGVEFMAKTAPPPQPLPSAMGGPPPGGLAAQIPPMGGGQGDEPPAPQAAGPQQGPLGGGMG